MYTVSKGPSQIVAKTRRGLAQKLESLDTIRDMTRKNSDSDDTADSSGSMSPPRPVFHAINGNSKRHQYSTQRSLQQHHHQQHAHHHHQHQVPQAEALSPQQEELIRYIYQRWQRVHRQLSTADRTNSSESTSTPAGPSVTYYSDSSPNPALQDFEPFDLEGWWGRRLYHTLTQSS